jgi:predicted phage terminase large subunit-like protein
MPRSPKYYVPQTDAPQILEEIHVRAEAKRRNTHRTFNPELGDTAEEADVKLKEMQRDVNKYGEYVYGLAPARHHRFWNEQVDRVITRRVPQNKILMMAPPNSAKSTWNSVIRMTHYLGNNPNHNLVFMTSSDDMAKTFASSVRTTLDLSDRHREVFPEDACRPDKRRGWSGEGLYLRGLDLGKKDPNYKAVGYTMNIMGARANGIVMDDVLDQKQAESEAECRKAIRYYDQTVVPRLNTRDGWLLAVMTRFSEGDLGGHFSKLAEVAGDWLIIKTPLEALENDPMGRLPGESLWPEQFPPEFIKATKARMQLAEYELVYQCDPTALGGDIFTNEKAFKPLPENFWQEIMPFCFVGQTVDCAFSEKKRTAFSVIFTYAVDAYYNMYILHIERQRMHIRDFEERFIDIARVCKPRVVGIETENFHDALLRGMVLRIMKRLMVNIQLIKVQELGDKIKRARLPAGRVEHGFVYVDLSAPWAREFLKECMGFPNMTYKDQVDAFSLAALMVQNLDEAALKEAENRNPIPVEMVLSG